MGLSEEWTLSKYFRSKQKICFEFLHKKVRLSQQANVCRLTETWSDRKMQSNVFCVRNAFHWAFEDSPSWFNPTEKTCFQNDSPLRWIICQLESLVDFFFHFSGFCHIQSIVVFQSLLSFRLNSNVWHHNLLMISQNAV